jgi:tetratricopeptide (TPR) repeat protein
MESLESHEVRRADFAKRFNAEKERRRELARHLESAKLLFQKRDIKAALSELDEAAVISGNDPDVQNLRGSCHVEMRDFDQALEAFEKAAEARKDNPSIQFNIGEVYFVTKRWQEALDVFEKVGSQLPPENTALARLVDFKILLCMKQLGRNAEALALADRQDLPDDSPFHCYAKAALAFGDGKPELADEWLATAAKRFPDPNVRAPWQDTLVEYGIFTPFEP